MPLIDLTVPLREGMPVWPGDPAPRLRYERSFEAGDKNNVSSVAMGLHTGTHMDAPKHFISGAGGMETLPGISDLRSFVPEAADILTDAAVAVTEKIYRAENAGH